MSINHFKSDLPETLWWQQQQQQHQSAMEPTQNTPPSKHHKDQTPPQNSLWTSHMYHQHHQLWLNSYNSEESPSMLPTQNPTLNFNLNQEDDEEELEDQTTTNIQQEEEPQQEELGKEPMFEKPLTPSDVGKLNRLVIPKQHAEKYFPLGGGDSGDKGLLLSFEDESGKYWRFRYSYWNSSQSYVLTKGWSRYVKEKRLDAGDIVLFERHRTDSDRLFIGWRRRGTAVAQDGSTMVAHSGSGGGGGGGSSSSSGGGWSNGLYSGHPYLSRHIQGHGVTVPYQPHCLHAGTVVQNQTTTTGNSKTVRLFGVNLECQLDESEPSTPDGPSLSSQDPVLHQHSYSQPYYSNFHNYMDITFSGDVKQMRNRRG